MEKVQCPYCGVEVKKGNFCERCGAKLVKLCDCWVLEPVLGRARQYDCGLNECPGHMLFTNPSTRSKVFEHISRLQ